MRIADSKYATLRGKYMPPDARETSADRFDRIYATIRERICLLHYPPGTVLNEAGLAAEFKVSRTPLRRVLQRLSFEELLVITNGVGTIVSDIDMKTFKDIYKLRILLADAMGDMSPGTISPKHIAAVDELIARAESLSAEQDVEQYAILANELQAIIKNLIGSAPLRDVTDVLYYRVARIWFTFLPSLDWREVCADQLNELIELREAMVQNDMRVFGQIRSRKLRGILGRISLYLSDG